MLRIAEMSVILKMVKLVKTLKMVKTLRYWMLSGWRWQG